MGRARPLLPFIVGNAIVWLTMTAILVVVPDTLERWMPLEIARVIGWAVACSVWVVAIERQWQERVGPLARQFSAHGLGMAEASDVIGSSGGNFEGTFVDGTALLVRFVRYGDANIDGTVNLQDFNRLASNFGGSDKLWSQGDFNYDGVVNLQDFNRLASNFGTSTNGPEVTPGDWAALARAIPEPSCALLWFGALVRRRRPATATPAASRAGRRAIRRAASCGE